MFKRLLLILFVLAQSVSAYAQAPTYIEIDIINRKLFLKSSDQVIKSYPIGVGRSKQFMTPPGNYKVITKDPHPGWLHPYNQKTKIMPGASNPLGTRWIGFHQVGNQAYGIHGTNEPSSIGKFVSHGCIRMLVPDSEDLYRRVQVGTPVIVRYNPIEVTDKDGDLILTLHEDPYGITNFAPAEIKTAILQKYPKAFVNELAIKALIDGKVLDQNRLIGTVEQETK
jgi:hypothetical protein